MPATVWAESFLIQPSPAFGSVPQRKQERMAREDGGKGKGGGKEGGEGKPFRAPLPSFRRLALLTRLRQQLHAGAGRADGA